MVTAHATAKCRATHLHRSVVEDHRSELVLARALRDRGGVGGLGSRQDLLQVGLARRRVAVGPV